MSSPGKTHSALPADPASLPQSQPGFNGSTPAWALPPQEDLAPGTGVELTEVLVIEGEEQNYHHLRHLLPPTHSCDFDFHWSSDIAAARTLIQERPWDLVFFDLALAQDSKEESVLGEIESIAQRVPLIILTDMDDEHVARDAIRRGAQDYMIKGEDTATALHRTIWAAIDRFHLTRDLKEKTEALEQAFWQKHQFLNTITHEIKTPMNGIRGGVQLLREDCHEPEQVESIDMIDAAIGNLMHLIDNLLEHGKAEAGQLDLHCEPVTIEEIIQPVVATFTMACQVKGIQLIADLKQPLPEVICVDRIRLHQVISNLVGNAIKFTRHGEIRVQCYYSQSSGHLHFAVRDTGCGISPEDQKTIFNPYNQGQDCDRSQAAKGTGLGLAICKEYVRLMGGEIRVQSAQGEGSQFSFSIPVSGEA